MELLTAAAMRAIEQEAIDAGRVTGFELMQRAGAGVINAAQARWPEELADPEDDAPGPWAIVLCGPGNNGGDGFVIARLLQAQGWQVAVFLLGEAQNLQGDAARACADWQAVGQIGPLTTQALEAQASRMDGDVRGMVIDALFGTGLNRPLSREMGQVLGLARSLVPLTFLRYVCVDIQSGFCADSGRFLGDEDHLAIFGVDLTVTFHTAKQGHVLADVPALCPHLDVVDIGLNLDHHEVTRALADALEGLSGAGDITQSLNLYDKPNATWITGYDALIDKAESGGWHKYDHGHAVVLSGGPGRGGAARLAARGALRIGAGLVTIACPLRAQLEHAAQLNAVMLEAIDGPSGLSELLEDRRVSSICLGPGLGLTQITSDLVRVVLDSGVPCVLDADALSRFARDPSALFSQLHEKVVLTPHAGEFKRLFPEITARLSAAAAAGPAYSKVDATRDAAAEAGAVVLFKGPDTVIAHPNGMVAVHAAFYDRSAPWLATAGAGDVLAGFIAGLLARGQWPMEAAQNAAWLHVECARRFGAGLIAEDLPEMLPRVLSE